MIARAVFLTVLIALMLAGQAPDNNVPAGQPDVQDSRATPRSAIFAYLKACREGDFRSAASFLDVRAGRRGAEAPELARLFKEVLDRKLKADPGLLSSNPEGDLTDGLDAKFELLGTVNLSGRQVDLLLERVSRQEPAPVWLVSSGTVSMIPLLHEDLGNTWVETKLPGWLLAPGPLDSAVWQWLALLLLTLLSFGLAALLARVVVQALRPLARRTPTEWDDRLIASLVNPLRLLMALAAYRAGLVWIVPSVLMRTYLGRMLAGLSYVALAWLAMRLIDVVATKVLASMTGRQRATASSVVPLIRRTAKVAALIIAVLATLASWGYNTTALLAGLGVGGIAIALAAQKTIENLFGGVAVTTDKPVLIGDFCRYGDKQGTIEDIGLRSTRIRTLDRTVVTVPNGQFSGLEIENFARRDKIWFHPTLRLRLDTTADQVRELIPALRSVLLNHPKVDPSPARVRFIGIADYSLDIEIFSYVLTTDFDEFLVVQEQLLLAMLDTITAAGTGLAVPSQLNVLTRDPLRATPRAEPERRVVAPNDGAA